MATSHPTPDFTKALQQQIAKHLTGLGVMHQDVTPETSLKEDLHLASLDLIEIVLAFEEYHPDCAKGELNWEKIRSIIDLSNALWALQFESAEPTSPDPLLQVSIRRAAARRRL
jgi:acyl carrier protein